MIYTSLFLNPVMNIIPIPCHKIISQPINPNSTTTKEFNALQQSILNTGFISVPCCVVNPDFVNEKGTIIELLEKSLFLSTKITGSTNNKFASQSDGIDRTLYEYELIDGTQRTGIIKLGTYYFYCLDENKQEEWSYKWLHNEQIPTKVGTKEMLMYLAWRNNFCVPCAIATLEDRDKIMSATVLANMARGDHQYDIVKDIVADMVKQGVDKKWIESNLFIDQNVVDRLSRVNTKASDYFNNSEVSECWIPEDDETYKQLQNAYILKDAYRYVSQFIEEHKEYIKEHNINTLEKLYDEIDNMLQ